MPAVFALIVYACLLSFGRADVMSHTYKDGERVILFVNKVGPFANPQETYPYYSLPFCKPKKMVQSKREGLGEALMGYELIRSPLEIKFREDVTSGQYCESALTLNRRQAHDFKVAIMKNYWYQLFFDDLPIWGMVGEYSHEDGKTDIYIYSHKKFSISYNQNMVISVNLTTESPVLVRANEDIEFTYSVTWEATDVEFEDRFRKYLDKSFFEHQIHWFSIFNSFMMVIFLVGLVAMILMRTLKRELRWQVSKDDDELLDDDLIEESGWKLLAGDVFRTPSYLHWFAAFVGTGHQLAILTLMVILLAIAGTYYTKRGTVVTAFVVCYALTSCIAGYSGGGYYARHGGPNWKKCMLITATVFPGTTAAIAFVLNFVALMYSSLSYIPFSTMIITFSIWIFVSVPLTLGGTIVGRNWSGQASYPCRTHTVPRQIPEKRWYLQPWMHITLGGVLPFGSIFIEMYFIFTSFYKYYYVYGFVLLVYVILVVVTICVTIVSTYFLLNSEDYRWQWTAFMSAGSTGGYVYLYSIYYYFMKTRMSGFFQFSFYFGYMAMFCLGLGLLCGAIGFIGTSVFVQRIYSLIKVD